MSAPLYNHIMKYSKNTTSFHMPGHKFGNILDMKDINLFDLDVTEVPGLDNLYEAEGVIYEAEKKMAKKYGAKESVFITNGSTSGIIASILTLCSPGDSLIVARNCHHSVWNAIILGGIKPIYINPGYDNKHNILGAICPLALDQALVDYPEAKGAMIVSPTYEGLVSDVQKIAEVIHKHDKILIVDEAHGAHFVWDQSFPKSALEQGADLVIQSTHKTLPAITQSALVHIGSHRVDKETLTGRLQMIQTSSPSYIMMGMMDYMRQQMEEQGSLWTSYRQLLFKTRKRLSKLRHLLLLEEDICGRANVYDIDKSKLVIFTYNTNITGIELGNILRSQYNIQVEVESKEYIIAMSTISDLEYELDSLCTALFEIDSGLERKITTIRHYDNLEKNHNSKVLPREIYFANKENISIDQSEGRISATNIMLYPPGIPLICIGEVFSKDTINRIKDLSNQIVGIAYEKNNIKVSVSK